MAEPPKAEVSDKTMHRLTPKQERFVHEYLIDCNATKAAIRAGYKEKTAFAIGHENLRKPKIAELLQQKMDERSARTQIAADNVLRELARLAFSDVRKFFDENGNLKPISELDDDAAACLAGFDVSTSSSGSGEDKEIETIKKIKIWDKSRNLELLARHLGLLRDDSKNINVQMILDFRRS